MLYVPLKLVLRYLLVTRMKKQTATRVCHERLNATGTSLLDPGIRTGYFTVKLLRVAERGNDMVAFRSS